MSPTITRARARGNSNSSGHASSPTMCDVKQAIANKIIALAKAGETNPDVLCEQVLIDIRTPQMEAAGS